MATEENRCIFKVQKIERQQEAEIPTNKNNSPKEEKDAEKRKEIREGLLELWGKTKKYLKASAGIMAAGAVFNAITSLILIAFTDLSITAALVSGKIASWAFKLAASANLLVKEEMEEESAFEKSKNLATVN